MKPVSGASTPRGDMLSLLLLEDMVCIYMIMSVDIRHLLEYRTRRVLVSEVSVSFRLLGYSTWYGLR